MKFLLSEGRAICLLEKEDADLVIPGKIPELALVIVPMSIRDHIERSHIWSVVLGKAKNHLRSVVYF